MKIEHLGNLVQIEENMTISAMLNRKIMIFLKGSIMLEHHYIGEKQFAAVIFFHFINLHQLTHSAQILHKLRANLFSYILKFCYHMTSGGLGPFISLEVGCGGKTNL